MKFAVLTGAGASRDLSSSPDEPLPLMSDWAQRLRERLGPELSQMATLNHAESGPDFEETLGALFRWAEMLRVQ